MKVNITQDILKSELEYNPLTGDFIRKKVSTNCVRVGSVAGSIDKDGYIKIGVNRGSYPAHRLAWLYSYGRWPKCEIDHINQVKTDNRLANLRDVTKSKNLRNSTVSKSNISGFTGVTWNKFTERWVSRVYSGGRIINLGSFTRLKDAVTARKLANIEYGYHENHGSQKQRTLNEEG